MKAECTLPSLKEAERCTLKKWPKGNTNYTINSTDLIFKKDFVHLS